MQNPIFLKHACMLVSETFDLLIHNTEGDTVRRMGKKLTQGAFELMPDECRPYSETVNNAAMKFATATGYERVIFTCYWKHEAAHAVVQVHGVNGRKSFLVYAGKV